MKTKNANVKTEVEAMHRMLDGEIFLYETKTKEYRLLFDAENAKFEYRAKNSNFSIRLNLNKFDLSIFMVEADWKDEVSEENPICCWVSDNKHRLKNKKTPALVTGINRNGGYRAGPVNWKYAEPIKKGEMKFWGEDEE